jgi:hypothetical protein
MFPGQKLQKTLGWDASPFSEKALQMMLAEINRFSYLGK